VDDAADVIRRLTHATIFVLDQERALRFYRDTLGFEVRADQTLDGFRWLTVGPAGQPELSLLLAVPGPPMFNPADADTLRTLVAKGVLGGAVVETDDCVATYEQLHAQGVVFLQGPTEQPYGIEAVFRDDSGNWFSLKQPA
jgi:catechol 2,3-dioxygenase-like lactoylglutathione lyase family enzyme